MKIVHVASEVAPYSQTGGLADVIGALPKAQKASNENEVIVFTPLYLSVREKGLGLYITGININVVFQSVHYRARIFADESGTVFFIDVPELFERDGLYGNSEGDYVDNALRFAVFSKIAVQAVPLILGGPADVLHAHDWQSALSLIYAKESIESVRPRSLIFTVHNLAYQGLFPKSVLPELGLSWSYFKSSCLEFFDQVNLMKAGLWAADQVTTVSPTYAREVMTPEFGCRLDGFLRTLPNQPVGVLNGIDTQSWDPNTDNSLVSNYERSDRRGKTLCREAVCRDFGFEAPHNELVIGVVSRFAFQKGLDLVAEVAHELPELQAHLIVLGTGEKELEDRFRRLSEIAGTRVHVKIDFNLDLARQMYAGCDVLLMPSRFEPCGLSQLYAMRYGTVPIAHKVGGLEDTIDDILEKDSTVGEKTGSQATGILFENADLGGVRWGIQKAGYIFRESPQRWRQIVENGMRRDFSWKVSANRYLVLYRTTLNSSQHHANT